MKRCPTSKDGRHVPETRTVPDRKPETVADLLSRDRCPRELRGKRIATFCVRCGEEL